jgi:hypothetical protein
MSRMTSQGLTAPWPTGPAQDQPFGQDPLIRQRFNHDRDRQLVVACGVPI